MIPTGWREHRREDDDELLGHIAPTDEAFQARTVFGYPMGAVSGQGKAEQTLESIGLSYLAELWSLSIDGRDEPITVQIVEVTPVKVTVKSVDYGYEGDYETVFTLDVPILPGRLRPERSLT
jgi:hypothetical protein